MSELLRFHIPRNPVVVGEKDYNKIGIESHPTAYRSKRFIGWAELCKRRDYRALHESFASFLNSEESIVSLHDHNMPATAGRRAEVADFLQAVLRKGKDLKTADLVSSFGEARLHDSKPLLFDAITRTADTFLAAVFLRVTSNVRGISYQDQLKLLFAIDRISAGQKEGCHFNFNLKDFLGRPIILPPCFFTLNACTKKFETRASVFTPDGDFGAAPERFEPAASGRDDASPSRIPEKDPCECEVDDSCQRQNPCCASMKPYVTDLMLVRDEVRCYVPGSLSYLENVLMGENRTRRHRRLERTEDYSEQQVDRSSYTEKDHEATERYSLQKETSDTVQQDLKLHAGVTYTAHYGTEKAGSSLTANFDANYDWSKSIAHKIAENYSKDVIDRSITKVEEKVRTLVTQRRIVETEERNKHVFDNVRGKDNISGQYFFVDQLSRAQMFNWGKRLVIDLRLPEPSELYKRLLQKQFVFDLEEPVKPTLVPTDITAKNYLSYVSKYSLQNVPAPPKATTDVVVHIDAEPPVQWKKGIPGYRVDRTGQYTRSDYNVTIPPDYVSDSMSSSIVSLIWNPDYNPPFTQWDEIGGVSLGVSLGGQTIAFYPSGSGNSNVSAVNCPGLEGTNPLGFQAWDVTRYDIILTVHCKIKAEIFLDWQLGIYNQIMDLYAKQKKEYDDAYMKALADFEAAQAVKLSRNPFLNRETERIALKQMAISYISCDFFDKMDAMKNKVRPCGFPQMDLEEAEREGRWVAFFEEAFEWRLMTYIFYPYFWSRKATWVDKMKRQADDLIFEKFLQAGFARAQVPVRPGFEAQVQYFLAFGEIWQGNDTPPIPGDPFYVSIAQEIREEKQNFNVDRSGTLSFTRNTSANAPNNTVDLTDPSAYYWDTYSNAPNDLNLAADIDREIIIDCKAYRITAIEERTPADPNHTTWTITLDRNYEGADFMSLKWSTGALYIGAPWEYTTPTQLVWLRGKAKCLPCLPIKCEEPE